MSWQNLHEAGRLKLQAYRDATKNSHAAQNDLLLSIIRANESCEFGRNHSFHEIGSYQDFSQRVPISGYDAYASWIDRIKTGQLDALSSDPPFAFEETGGSSGGRKLIPYNSELLKSFQNSVLAWLCDLQNQHPGIAKGPAYFAISPTTRNAQKMVGGLPVGLPSDALYFGEEHVADVVRIMLGAEHLSGIRDFETWQTATLSWLLAAENLSFISIWSPTFLTTLLAAIRGNEGRLVKAIRNGEFGLEPNEKRSQQVAHFLKQDAIDTAGLWPQLVVISTWADAGSARFYGQLKSLFPGVTFQPKGLLSTEGIVTFPYADAEFPLPALTSTFLEFEAPDGEVYLLHELEENAIYKVIITTPGGLYRYRNEDQVQCMGFYNGLGAPLPMLTFYGRGDCTLDMVGEKFDEGFIAHCLQNTDGFAALCPIEQPHPHYALLIETVHANPNKTLSDVGARLRENPLYADARTNGQLGELALIPVENAETRYVNWRLSKGHRMADIKMPILIANKKMADEIWPHIGTNDLEKNQPGVFQ